ncbi:MAG: hypothetical protein PF441_06060 [Desulfuromusa sp.]|nr:hypothetical protein [Desulfuromusa sp.]
MTALEIQYFSEHLGFPTGYSLVETVEKPFLKCTIYRTPNAHGYQIMGVSYDALFIEHFYWIAGEKMTVKNIGQSGDFHHLDIPLF